MKRFLLPLFVLLFSLLTTLSFAAEAKPTIYPQPTPTPPTMEQQNQYYWAVFSGDGEAKVAAKITLSNFKEEAINSVTLEIPGSYVRMINVLQEVTSNESYCLQYMPTQQSPMEGKQKVEGGVSLSTPPVCDSWGLRPYYSNPTYYTLQPNLQKSSDAYRYTIPLAQTLSNQRSTTLLLYYKVVGYADKNILGSYKFDFSTIKSDSDVNTVRVAINVQEGLYLKGGKAKVDYKPSGVIEESPSMSLKGASDSRIQNFSSQITYAQGYVKETSGLDPWESFHVKGSFAERKFVLYLPEIFTGILILAGFVLLVFAVWKILRKIHIKKPKIVLSPFVTTVVLGVGSTIGIIVTVVSLNYIMNWLPRLTLDYTFEPILFLLVGTLFLIVIFFVSFGPLVFVGWKFGLKYVAVYIVVVILSLILATGGLLVFFQLMSDARRGGGVEPMPVPMSSTEPVPVE